MRKSDTNRKSSDAKAECPKITRISVGRFGAQNMLIKKKTYLFKISVSLIFASVREVMVKFLLDACKQVRFFSLFMCPVCRYLGV